LVVHVLLLKASVMSYLDDILDEILALVQVDDAVVAEARARRTAVLDATAGFDGCLRDYRCGSLAYGTAITPPDNKPSDKGVDGDGGIVLDRRVWTTLGPDSTTGKGPTDVVEQVQDHIRPTLQEEYPNVRVGTSAKRAIRVTFGEPLDTGEDPPVELIVALTRKDAPGLWIPNLIADSWDPAHPEEHRRMINDQPSTALRVRRARVTRLAKRQNKAMTAPAFSPFHLQALALATLTEAENGRRPRSSLKTFFADSADRLEEAMTQDPAGVSGAFHLENGVTRTTAVRRLRTCADALAEAADDPDDKDHVKQCLKRIFEDTLVDEAHNRFKFSALSTGNSRLLTAAVVGAGIAGMAIAARGRRGPARKQPSAWAPRR
jgi:hypothetical protein